MPKQRSCHPHDALQHASRSVSVNTFVRQLMAFGTLRVSTGRGDARMATTLLTTIDKVYVSYAPATHQLLYALRLFFPLSEHLTVDMPMLLVLASPPSRPRANLLEPPVGFPGFNRMNAAALLRQAQTSRYDGREEPAVRAGRLHPAAVLWPRGPAATVLLHAQERGRRRREVHKVCVLSTGYAGGRRRRLLLCCPNSSF